MPRTGMSCSCELGDDAMVVQWCAAHARAYRKAVADEREACKIAAATYEAGDPGPHETYADGRRAAAAKISARGA